MKHHKVNSDYPLLVFGGVYSNLQALHSLLQKAEELNIPYSNMICTGDIVGYCAQPEECLTLIQELGIVSIAGNVELQLRDQETDCGCDFSAGSRCDLFSKQWYPFAQKSISEQSLRYLDTLSEQLIIVYGEHRIGIVHGSFFHVSEFIFESTSFDNKKPNFDVLQVKTIIAGHCGLPFLDQQQDEIWFNPGVIGMPANDGTSRVWYGLIKIVDKNCIQCSVHYLDYNFKEASNLMKLKKLPESYAQTLVTGIWDNCDILPEIETKQQGIPLKEKSLTQIIK